MQLNVLDDLAEAMKALDGKSTVFVISVTRPRSEWFPRTMPLRAGDSSPCCATNARCSWKVKISHVCSKEIETKSLDSLGICQITPGTSLNVFLGADKLHLAPSP